MLFRGVNHTDVTGMMYMEGYVAKATGIQFSLPWREHPATLAYIRWTPSIRENEGGRYN